jgi:nucleoside-diphosphate-sugar epimerase
MKETVLITGGTGFLGSHLVYTLLDQGYKIILLKRPFSNMWRINKLLPDLKIYDMVLQDIKAPFLENKIDIIIHTACCYGRRGESLSSIASANTSFGIEILENAIINKVDTFINTDTIFDKYFSPYTLSKRQFVEWLDFFSGDIKVINMKLEHMYGPNDDDKKFVSWLLQQLKENVEEIRLTAGTQKRDFIYIFDVVSAYLTVICDRLKLDRFNEFEVGTGKAIPVRDFVQELEKQYKFHNPKCKSRLLFGGVPYRKGEMMTAMVDTSGLTKLGWKPEYCFKEGIRDMLDTTHHHQYITNRHQNRILYIYTICQFKGCVEWA